MEDLVMKSLRLSGKFHRWISLSSSPRSTFNDKQEAWYEYQIAQKDFNDEILRIRNIQRSVIVEHNEPAVAQTPIGHSGVPGTDVYVDRRLPYRDLRGTIVHEETEEAGREQGLGQQEAHAIAQRAERAFVGRTQFNRESRDADKISSEAAAESGVSWVEKPEGHYVKKHFSGTPGRKYCCIDGHCFDRALGLGGHNTKTGHDKAYQIDINEDGTYRVVVDHREDKSKPIRPMIRDSGGRWVRLEPTEGTKNDPETDL